MLNQNSNKLLVSYIGECEITFTKSENEYCIVNDKGLVLVGYIRTRLLWSEIRHVEYQKNQLHFYGSENSNVVLIHIRYFVKDSKDYTNYGPYFAELFNMMAKTDSRMAFAAKVHNFSDHYHNNSIKETTSVADGFASVKDNKGTVSIYNGKQTDLELALRNLSKDSLMFADEENVLLQKHKKNTKDLDALQTELKDLPVISKPNKPVLDFSYVLFTYFGTALGISAGFFLFHCVVWFISLFGDISWNTWAWTKWAFIITMILATLGTITRIVLYLYNKEQYATDLELYEYFCNKRAELEKSIRDYKTKIKTLIEELDTLHNVRFTVLANAYKDRLLSIPIPLGTITKENYSKLKQTYFGLVELKKKAASALRDDERITLKKELADKKLRVFYENSLKTNVPADIYEIFYDSKSPTKSMDEIRRAPVLPSFSINRNIQKLDEFTALLNDNTMEPFLKEFQKVKNRNVKGILFTKTDEQSKQTKEMHDLVQVAANEYSELITLNEKIGQVLAYAKVCALRNLYLGVELLNFTKDDSGGGNLAIDQEVLEMDIPLFDMPVNPLQLEAKCFDTAVSTLCNVAQLVGNDKDIRKLFTNHTKAAGIAVAAAVVGSVLNEHGKKVEENESIQSKLVENMDIISRNYVQCQAVMLRSIEIIKSLIKTNQGFMTIYEMTRKEYFDNNRIPSIQDTLKLTNAIKEYKTISTTSIYGTK